MKKTKSKAAYTNKWLHRNQHLWHEDLVHNVPQIILHISDAPKIVNERVIEINLKRREKGLHNIEDNEDIEFDEYYEED